MRDVLTLIAGLIIFPFGALAFLALLRAFGLTGRHQ
jgi:hypothetical protein